MLASKKKGYGLTAHYIISIDPIEIDKTSINFVGKLKPTTTANSFTLYDNGSDAKTDLDIPLRRELGYFFYV